MITSSVEREGMVSNHLISSEGQIHAQALITWEEIDKETLWKSEDKTEKRRLDGGSTTGCWPMLVVRKIPSMYWEMVS